MTLLATFVVLAFVYSLVSRRLDATIVTGPIVFTLAGITMQAIAPVGFSVGDNTKIFLHLAEVGLARLESSNCIQMCQLPCADLGIYSLASLSS